MGRSIGKPEVGPGAESDAQLSTEPSAEPAGAQSSIEPDAGSRTRLNAESSAELNVEPSLSGAQVRKVSEGEPGKPKHRCKRLLIVCGVVVVVAVVALISLAIIGGKHFGSSSNYRPNSPEDIMVRYLHDKYGKDFKLVGEMRRERGSALREHYYESDAHPIDDTRLRFRVVLDGDNKEHKYEKSDTYLEAGRVLAEEDRLQPYAERIFGKNTKVGVEFRLCERGEASMKGITGLPQAMSICKEETADMTKEEIIDSSLYNDSGLSHDYSVYIYALDGQSIKTDSDKTKIVKGLKELLKYLPNINSDLLDLYYFIRGDKSSEEGTELAVSAEELSAEGGVRKLVGDFNNKLTTVSKIIFMGIGPPSELSVPGRKGWLD